MTVFAAFSGTMWRLILWECALYILCGFRCLVLWGDSHYIGSDADWMGHQGQQIPQPRTYPLFLHYPSFHVFSVVARLSILHVCFRKGMGLEMMSTHVLMMAAGSSSGTMLAVNLTLIPAGRKVCTLATVDTVLWKCLFVCLFVGFFLFAHLSHSNVSDYQMNFNIKER